MNIKLIQICNKIMVIVKLGKVEKTLLKSIANKEVIGKTPSTCRGLKRLKEKGLIVDSGTNGMVLTSKAKELAITAMDKNKIRNDRKTLKKLGEVAQIGKTYVAYASAISAVIGKEEYKQLVFSGKAPRLYRMYATLKEAKVIASCQLVDLPEAQQTDQDFLELTKKEFFLLLQNPLQQGF